MADEQALTRTPLTHVPTPPTRQGGALENTFEELRQSITCNVCIRLMYEPFTIHCGHSSCYSCLVSWFETQREKRKPLTCPDCRTTVKEQPAPSYAIRKLVQLVSSQPALLPEDETIEEHRIAQEEETLQVEGDKDNTERGGLFRGCFSSNNRLLFRVPRRNPMHDHEDGVVRCPECLWELEDGWCPRCGMDWANESDFDDNTNSSIVSIPPLGDWPLSPLHLHHLHHHNHRHHHHDHDHVNSESETSDQDENEDDDDSEVDTDLSGFIADEDEDEDDNHDRWPVSMDQEGAHVLNPRPTLLEDEDAGAVSIVVDDEDSSQESDDTQSTANRGPLYNQSSASYGPGPYSESDADQTDYGNGDDMDSTGEIDTGLFQDDTSVQFSSESGDDVHERIEGGRGIRGLSREEDGEASTEADNSFAREQNDRGSPESPLVSLPIAQEGRPRNRKRHRIMDDSDDSESSDVLRAHSRRRLNRDQPSHVFENNSEETGSHNSQNSISQQLRRRLVQRQNWRQPQTLQDSRPPVHHGPQRNTQRPIAQVAGTRNRRTGIRGHGVETYVSTVPPVTQEFLRQEGANSYRNLVSGWLGEHYSEMRREGPRV